MRPTALLQPSSEQLDVRSSRTEHINATVSCPLEEPAQVVAVGLERAAVVAGKERRRRELGLVESGAELRVRRR